MGSELKVDRNLVANHVDFFPLRAKMAGNCGKGIVHKVQQHRNPKGTGHYISEMKCKAHASSHEPLLRINMQQPKEKRSQNNPTEHAIPSDQTPAEKAPAPQFFVYAGTDPDNQNGQLP